MFGLTACFGLGGSGGGNITNQKEVEYTADDIVYVTDAGETITTVSGRPYTKKNSGTVAVALACINGYTGPILVGRTPGSVSYTFKYNGTNVVDKYGTLTVDGKDWYYSLNIGFMHGNALDFYKKLPIYCSKKGTAEEVAKELIAIMDKGKIETLISTVEQLKAIANTAGNYSLVNDIDLGGESNWQPIENFSGCLNGNGHSVKNLTINAVNAENIGLFAIVSGTVENLKIENAQITSRGDIGKAGIVASTNSGTIKNVIVNGSVIAEYYDNVGGIVGYNNNGFISNCENQALVTGNNNVGGIAGYVCVNGDNKANSNVNNGEISGKSNVGGVFGYLTSQTKKTDNNFSYALSENTNNNSVNGKSNVGGVIGNITPAGQYTSNWNGLGFFTLSVFTNNGEVVSTGDCVGGIVGYADRLSEITVSENNSNISGGNFVGGYVGKSGGTTIKIAKNNSVITGKGYVGGIAGYAGKIDNATNNGEIVSIAIIVENGASKSYVGGIAGYCTSITNSKNTINITVANAGSFVGGLVGYLRVDGNEQLSGNENLGNVQGKDSVGGIVGYATMSTKRTDNNFNYSFSNNVNNGSVSGTSEVGGIVGNLVGAGKHSSNWYGLGYFDVSLCENNAEIVGSGNNVGGIFGYAIRLATMTVSENNADIIGSNYVGGYVGNARESNIKLAINNNSIFGKGYVGGIAGVAGKLENCTNNGIVNSTGVIVEDSTSMAYVGGLVGYCTGLANCINNSDISVATGGQYVGGLAGFISFSSDNQINDNQNYGKISGSKYTGGIAGYMQSATVKTDNNYTRSISTNKNCGIVRGTEYVAGIFGYVYGAGRYSSNWYGVCNIIITYCENEAEITGSSYVGGIVGGYTRLKTDANLMDTNTTLYGEKLGQ